MSLVKRFTVVMSFVLFIVFLPFMVMARDDVSSFFLSQKIDVMDFDKPNGILFDSQWQHQPKNEFFLITKKEKQIQDIIELYLEKKEQEMLLRELDAKKRAPQDIMMDVKELDVYATDVIAPLDREGMIWMNDQNQSLLQRGKIVNSSRFEQGGKVLVVPFRAGKDVEASEELDKVAMMIIRGVFDVLGEANTDFELIIDENAGQADFILDGYITSVGQSSRLKRWINRKVNIDLKVEGKMIDRNTGEVVFVFSDVKTAQVKEPNYQKLGLNIGQDIARFILTNTSF